MTPTEHATAAEAILDNFYKPGRIASPIELTFAEAHAHLSRASGTGDHYARADELLTKAAALLATSYIAQTRVDLGGKALIHAILAESAAA